MTAVLLGSIINYSSVEPFHAVLFTVVNVASKFAIRGLTPGAAAMELAGHGIRANCVRGPGGSAAFVSEAPMSDTMRQFHEARTIRPSPDPPAVNDGVWGDRSSATMDFLPSDDSVGYVP